MLECYAFASAIKLISHFGRNSYSSAILRPNGGRVIVEKICHGTPFVHLRPKSVVFIFPGKRVQIVSSQYRYWRSAGRVLPHNYFITTFRTRKHHLRSVFTRCSLLTGRGQPEQQQQQKMRKKNFFDVLLSMANRPFEVFSIKVDATTVHLFVIERIRPAAAAASVRRNFRKADNRHCATDGNCMAKLAAQRNLHASTE